MDQDLQQRIEEAKAAGYSDEEIAKALGTAPPSPQATLPSGITVPILSAEEKAQFNQSEQRTRNRNSSENDTTALMTMGAGAAAVGVPAAVYYGGKAILNPGVRASSELANRGVNAMEEANKINRMNAERIAANQAAKAAPVAPVAPSPILDAQGRPMQAQVRPVAPEPTMQNRVQAAAAQRITNLPKPGMMASAGRMAGKLLPGVGTALNAADAYNRFQEDDYLGAGIAAAGAAASPFPIVGTAIGAGTGALNAYRDYLKRQEEEKLRMMK
jgi:hypothetical protein